MCIFLAASIMVQNYATLKKKKKFSLTIMVIYASSFKCLKTLFLYYLGYAIIYWVLF